MDELTRLRPRDERTALHVVCFPHCGGGPSGFRAWPEGLGPDVAVSAYCPPGRERRVFAPLVRELRAWAGEAAGALADEPPQQLVLAGHSMGALVAYETALRLPGVRMLVATGHGAPHLRPSVVRDPDAPAAQLVEQLRGLGGLPERVLANSDLLDLVLPVFRADLAAAAGYTCDPAGRLACPLHAAAGTDDPLVPDAGLAGWRERTTGPATSRRFPGGHFFLDAPGGFLAWLRDLLSDG